jgi:methanogenic corrinoid protein MtbC1
MRIAIIGAGISGMNGPYKIGTLARLTGFSPALLRAWEKRFGLISPDRGDGRQRVYGDDDLAVLSRVRTLVDQGRSIGEIAAQGRNHLLMGTDREVTATDDRSHTSPVGAGAFCTRIVSAALGLDARKLGTALDEAFATLGADRVVADVITPAAVQIGDLWETGRCTVASEHMASSRFLQRLGRLLESAQPASESAPRVVAACFPDEHHQLGLLIVAWHLARHGVSVTYLGSAMPLEDLAKACRAIKPRALLLSVMRRPAFERQQREVARLFPEVPERVYVGGCGVPATARSTNRRVVFMPEAPIDDVVRRIVADLVGGARTRAPRRKALTQ